jgi:hypothetical protein
MLARAPDQLAHRLHGRLIPSHGATIARLLEELEPSLGVAPEWGPYLTPPGAELRRFEGHTKTIWSVALLPGGRQALSVSSDQTVRLSRCRLDGEKRLFVPVLPFGIRKVSPGFLNYTGFVAIRVLAADSAPDPSCGPPCRPQTLDACRTPTRAETRHTRPSVKHQP